MSIYEISKDSVKEIMESTFDQLGIHERRDLQKLLRDNIEIIAPGVMIIAEEFGQWEDSRRRIDLLGIDHEANLVVIELKRTEDGGHMDLQSIRYAAMISTMTFSKVVNAHQEYLEKAGKNEAAENAILEFLGWDGKRLNNPTGVRGFELVPVEI